ncbi:MAG TPA: hypothetical protein VFD64_11870 [Gemmatimonadaceae bacterium]|nr:hypothetical protein [Gemmatimonadaceae bacterium]
MKRILTIALSTAAIISCAGVQTRSTTSAASEVASDASGTIAQIYYWRAKPGKFEEYTRYVRDVAEPIDEEAHRRGAFLSVTTYMTQDTASLWTHMRVFVLRDSAQLRGLSAALDSAGRRLEPDSVKRSQRGEYSATLRDRVGAATVAILR